MTIREKHMQKPGRQDADMQCHEIATADANTRLDRFIRRHIGPVAQSVLEKWARRGMLTIDGKRAKPSSRVQPGQQLRMPSLPVAVKQGAEIGKKPAPTIPPDRIEALRQAVIARGEGWIAINKPAGLAVQGGSGTRLHIDAMLPHAFPGQQSPRLVHRLDRDTSGVLVVATELAAARDWTHAFRQHQCEKTYLALVLGRPRKDQGLITAPLLKSGRPGAEKMVADDAGDEAETRYQLLDSAGDSISLLALRPKTGRTHQLRAHCVHLGCPILGDGKYGGKEVFPSPSINRMMLHAVSLRKPSTPLIIAPLPAAMKQAIAFFGFDLIAIMRMLEKNGVVDGD